MFYNKNIIENKNSSQLVTKQTDDISFKRQHRVNHDIARRMEITKKGMLTLYLDDSSFEQYV